MTRAQDTEKYIDLTPGPQEQENLLAFFAQAVIDDVRQARKDDTRHLLRSVVDLAFTLGFNAGADAEETKDTKAGLALRERILTNIA